MVTTPVYILFLENSVGQSQRKILSLGIQQNLQWLDPNVHSHTLDLIAEFDELPLKDFDFELKAHPVHENFELEQMNILNELIGKIQKSSSNSVSNVVT